MLARVHPAGSEVGVPARVCLYLCVGGVSARLCVCVCTCHGWLLDSSFATTRPASRWSKHRLGIAVPSLLLRLLLPCGLSRLPGPLPGLRALSRGVPRAGEAMPQCTTVQGCCAAVSYTHLTLPTICSV
eukprot:1137515-Alexandrium_andersonii.AAC.1